MTVQKLVVMLTGTVVDLLQVGVIIGKAGETIRYLQLHSGAKIQVTGDNEAEPGALTRSAELSGTPEQISKAEQLIKEVLAEVLLVPTISYQDRTGHRTGEGLGSMVHWFNRYELVEPSVQKFWTDELNRP